MKAADQQEDPSTRRWG